MIANVAFGSYLSQLNTEIRSFSHSLKELVYICCLVGV